MSIELWAGLECTVNRVHSDFIDQVKRTGHHHRASDVALIASLGIKKLRYPVLWERTAPDHRDPDWTWSDARLRQLRDVGIEPIIGLLHHGSGPRHTSLTDPEFPVKFSRYARAVAERYPWANDYTPINEPLTTARFSALYGHWYPHARDNYAFTQALLLQCTAIVLAMREIRGVNPEARLVQTEDLGKTFSTPTLKYQADFENERRWATYELLSGCVDRHHPLWSYFLYAGVRECELAWFQQNTCPPDILGINHYVTSDRYLDERVDLFPEHCSGSNGRESYADVEAVRVDAACDWGPEHRLREAWQRYHRPLAITEAHLGCAEESERIHWLHEMWSAAKSAAAVGVDVRAVTVWALFGSYDWNSLVTRQEGHYEPGIFDVRYSPPRPTKLSTLISDLVQNRNGSARFPRGHGWWRLDSRIHYRVCDSMRVDAVQNEDDCFRRL